MVEANFMTDARRQVCLTMDTFRVAAPGRIELQSTLVISTLVISNNRLSRRENLIPV